MEVHVSPGFQGQWQIGLFFADQPDPEVALQTHTINVAGNLCRIENFRVVPDRDVAAIHVTTDILIAEYRYYTKQKSNLGTGTFSGTTTSGVPVAGQGRVSGNYDSATITITDLIVGEPAGDHCAFTGLSFKVNVAR